MSTGLLGEGVLVAEDRHLISSHAWSWWFIGVMAVNLVIVVGINWYFNNKRKQQQPTTAPH
ncbi:hypothetical protein [Corynebacterium dentalis]|uniref:hypothetical protein n=1 Tax=Corynebacterium dentalis TaxID=2014528 RepID=UPI00117766B9|nr:hypothetical protein [Corynebacterium dentalis]